MTTLLLTSSADLAKKGNEVASQLAQQCRKRFMNIEQNYCLAASTRLDLRFKSLPFKNSDNTRVTKEKVVRELQRIIPGQEAANSENADSSEAPPGEVGGIWAMFDEAREKKQAERSCMADAHLEMRKYGEEPLVTRETDPLEWWKNREECFKYASILARKYLGIVATSVPSERLFSKAGQVISDRRASILPQNVNMMLFLNDYLKQ